MAILFPGHGCMDDLTTERSFDSQVVCVIGVLGLLFDLLSTGVCTTRHWQTSSRLVQELNVCTVVTNKFTKIRLRYDDKLALIYKSG